MSDSINYQQFAEELVKYGGLKSLDYFKKIIEIDVKPDKSLVSEADRIIEEMIVKKIRSKFPQHSIYGEETERQELSNKGTWIIDPIEGTTNFLHGIPVFGTQVAYMENGELIAAAMYEPVSKTLVSASKGNGALINGNAVELSGQALESVTLLFDTGRDKKLVNRFFETGMIGNFRSFRRLGSLVTDVVFLLNGYFSVYIAFTGKLYDFAPAALILSESGYKVTDDSLISWTPNETVSLFAAQPENFASVKSMLKTVFKKDQGCIQSSSAPACLLFKDFCWGVEV